ncbi:hypothetical protein [Streptomyces sp. NBC_00233]|uniref:hypothetical protein n=1 Tax=Streptomyces sp. NBC_00233 TaxID=2975686 RepID=UPI00225346FA|nr:hypothetical protein [Streptomyces sp. NBC_00233]MCX5232728.1 hypothetical protein [Streptomyces sp. NBC_00233]
MITPIGVAWGILAIESGGGNTALLPPMVLAGLGAGLAFMPIFATVSSTGLHRYSGAASAALLTAQAMGGGLGAALLGDMGAPPWWAVLCLLLAGLTAGLMVRDKGTVPPGGQPALHHRTRGAHVG